MENLRFLGDPMTFKRREEILYETKKTWAYTKYNINKQKEKNVINTWKRDYREIFNPTIIVNVRQ